MADSKKLDNGDEKRPVDLGGREAHEGARDGNVRGEILEKAQGERDDRQIINE